MVFDLVFQPQIELLFKKRWNFFAEAFDIVWGRVEDQVIIFALKVALGTVLALFFRAFRFGFWRTALLRFSRLDRFDGFRGFAPIWLTFTAL